MTDPARGPSVLSQLQPFISSTEDSVAYEAALEAINGAVGAYSAVLAAEEAEHTPNRAAVEAARAGQAECAARAGGVLIRNAVAARAGFRAGPLRAGGGRGAPPHPPGSR